MAFLEIELIPKFKHPRPLTSPRRLEPQLQRVDVQMTGVTEGSGLSLSNIITDRPFANGKGLVDGILVWSEVMVGGTTPSKLDIEIKGSRCSLKKTLRG